MLALRFTLRAAATTTTTATTTASTAAKKFITTSPSISRPQSTTAELNANSETRQGWLFVDSVFPIQIARWDLRHYIGVFREESLLSALKSRLESVKAHNFNILSLEPHQKDGGVFVRFSYTASDPECALNTIESKVREETTKHGALPSWLGIGGGNVWLVKGTPWREDMNRFASPILKVVFEGPDVHEQSLYDILRPYGRIQDLLVPTASASGAPRFTIVTFQRLCSATIARNVLHGLDVSPALPGGPHSDNQRRTRLRTTYQQPTQAHAMRDWMSSHPKIMLPLLVFFLGTLTYTIFDPLRSLMVQGRMLDWFNYREFKLYKWLRINTIDRLSVTFHHPSSMSSTLREDIWKERKEAATAVKAYLTDMPTTITFVHGPQGSGKTSMLQAILRETGRKYLVIDCRELHKATSDTQLVGALARQTGYWPVFTFLNSLNNLIDLASVGLIGQKAGLTSSLTDQLHQILSVVGTALKGVSSSHRSAIQRQIRNREIQEAKRKNEAMAREKIKRGTWHDGRLDCVAGNGVMSELGIGDELIGGDDMVEIVTGELEHREDTSRKQKVKEELEAVASLPIVVIRNYAAKVGSNREELLEVLAQWAAMLAETQVAHVIVISDNRENFKFLAKALQSKPPSVVPLSDADSRSSLSFVRQKLQDADIDIDFTPQQMTYVERLGGRASDLESLIHKVRSGRHIEEAVEDIINRGVGELRKNAFGEDIDDARNLPWSRQQAWAVLKALSTRGEVPYHDILSDFPFKGDDTPLRSMEHAELISIGTFEGRASTIRPGKPVFRWVFERLVNDPVFRATQEIAFNEKVITNSESIIHACEEELVMLKGIISVEPRQWWKFGLQRTGATSLRCKYLFDKMLTAERKIEILEKANRELKKVLAKVG
ncbi:RNA12 protein-domain-containing protein [Collybia nuda]|uniref:Mitochondrial escape protein 2 n=1 Tax=Collybia nuda TaxID=64659 RepID=A0A9P5XZ48_9AGAR|nr:RNA12 protein-domain-containing protein [Collybia nuda]